MRLTSLRPPGRFGLRSAFALSWVGALAMAGGCDGGNPVSPEDRVASVEITTAPEELETGASFQLFLDIRDGNGDAIDLADVILAFSTSEASVAGVSGSGLVTAAGPGEVTITVQIGRAVDAVAITVVPEISSIEFLDAGLLLVAGEILEPRSTVLDARGEPVVGPVLDYVSSQPLVATIDATGVLTARSAGSATITILGGGEVATLEVEVLAAAAGSLALLSFVFTVSVGDEVDLMRTRPVPFVRIDGRAVLDETLEFASTDPSVLDVDVDGRLVARAPGQALITVTSPDVQGSATMRVKVLPAGSLTAFGMTAEGGWAKNTVRLDSGDFDVLSLRFDARADGMEIIDLLPSLASSDESVATVSLTLDLSDITVGLVEGVAPGTATITATTGERVAEVVVTVLGD